MKKDLLVIVDMVNGFVREGNLHDFYINHITKQIKSLTEEFIRKGNHIVAFKDCHQLGDIEFETYPVHCLEGTSESELIPELKPLESNMVMIPKNTTNGFNTKQFQEFYMKHYKEIENIVVVGCCTDICVTDFTTSLVHFQQENGIEVPIIVPIDMVETFDSEVHPREVYNELGFEKMRKAGVTLVSNYSEYKKTEKTKRK